MIEAGLITARLLHYVAVTTLAGASFFPLYAYRRGSGPRPIALHRSLQRALFIASNAAFFSGVLWFVFAVANMSGTLDGVLDWEMLSTVLGDTSFGKVWAARLILTIVLIVVIRNRFDSKSALRSNVIVPVLAAALVVSLAGVGHSHVEEGIAGAVHVVSDAAHLLAAGAWLGGLLPLGFILLNYAGNAENSVTALPIDLDRVLLRFSGMGYVAVATLIGSGLVNSWFLVGTVSGLLETAYGRVLVTNLVLFAGMLALAVSNRFWIVPSLAKARTDRPSVWTARLSNHVLCEQLLGLIVLLIVSVLGTMRPAIGQ
jgi:putative copper resistance protein D